MRGNLQQSSLAVLLRHFYAERKTGTLHLSANGAARRIYFRKGVPVFADAGAGETLPARPQAESILCSTFGWATGEFAFQDGEPSIDERLSLGKPPAELILEGARSIDDGPTLDRFLGTAGTVYACSKTTELPLFSVKLSPAESAILKFARERDRFRGAQVQKVSSELSARRALNALVSLGLLEIVAKEEAPAPPPAPVAAPPPPPPPPPSRPKATPKATPPPAPAAPPPPRAVPRPIPPPAPDPEPLPVVEVITAAPAPPPPPEPPPAPEPEPEPVLVAEPVVEPVVETVPREVAQLFDRFEATVAREAPRPAPAPMTVIDELPDVEAPFPEVDEQPVPPARATPPPARATLAGAKNKMWVFAALGGAFLLAVALVVWLSGGKGPSDESDAVVSAAASDPAPEPPAVETDTATDVPSVADVAVPSEAELFFQASLAFENGDFDRARLELQTLLELKPDFTPAQNLLARVEREIAAAREQAAPAPKPTPPPRPVAERVQPKPEPVRPLEPAKPTPGQLFDGARGAFQRGDLNLAEAKLEELRAVDAGHPGARELRGELEQRRWEQSLPRTYRARHDHRIGGCDGTVSLTAQGLGYRSSEHEWIWSFSELARADRKNERQLAVETSAKKTFNFQLQEPLGISDWSRFMALRK